MILVTTSLDALPKKVKELPEEAQKLWAEAYNRDFGWRCSEAHAEKAAWRSLRLAGYAPDAEGVWKKA